MPSIGPQSRNIRKKYKMEQEISYSISEELLPDELGELLNLAFKKIYESEKLPKIITGSTAYVTARDAGRLIGFGRILSDSGTIAYINYMAVNPKYQGQGIGQRILELLIDAAGDVNSIYLYTNTADTLYQRNGFHLSEKRLYVYRTSTNQ